MRSPLLALLLTLANVCAQNQERSLIDRLLRPNLELRNSQQGKIFRTDSKVVPPSTAAKPVVIESTVKEKTFFDTRVFETKKSPSIRPTIVEKKVFGDTRPVIAPAPLTTSSVADVHPTDDVNMKATGRNFADQHAFKNQGKSQKSLNRQNPPLTIDQVRELLNKNK